MISPVLNAFKSLDQVDDAIVAKEKRIIKESLEESDYKVDEDALDIEYSPIENTFTASNLYEGLDGIDEEEVVEDEVEEKEELDEEILDEKLPRDLAKAYRRMDRDRVKFFGDDRRQSAINYEEANYEEITPEEAIKAKKDGRIQDLRILKDGTLIVYRDDAYPLTGIDWVEQEDRFTNRNGKVIKDTRLMPLSHVAKIADKIYITDEKDHYFPSGKWVKYENGESGYVYDDPTQLARIQQKQDMVPDTGKHKRVERDYRGNIKYGWGTPEYEENKAKEYEKEVAVYEKKLADLEAQWEAGDISKNDYEKRKASLEGYLNTYKNYAEEAKVSAIRRRGAIATQAAEDRFALAKEVLQSNIRKYINLKRDISSAEYDLKKTQERGGAYTWNLKGGSYEEKMKQIAELKKEMERIQKQLEKLQSEATDELKQANLDQNAQALADAQKKVDDLKAELKSLLGKAHKSSGKEESLNEAMVDLRNSEEVEKAIEERDSKEDEVPVEQIVDPNATIVDELQKSYVGDAILECTKCLGHHYKDPKELKLSEEVDSEGNKLYDLEEECPTCHAKEGFTLIGQVAELSDEEKEEPVEEETKEVEVKEIETPEVEEVKEEEVVEEGLNSIDETSFDSHISKYLTEVYDNVESYKSTKGSETDDGIIIEGLITFKSGKEKPTSFKLTVNGDKINGLNEGFSTDTNIYEIEGTIVDNCFITENIKYKYNIGDELVEGCTKIECSDKKEEQEEDKKED